MYGEFCNSSIDLLYLVRYAVSYYGWNEHPSKDVVSCTRTVLLIHSIILFSSYVVDTQYSELFAKFAKI